MSEPPFLKRGTARELFAPLPASCYIRVLSLSPFEAGVANLGFIKRDFQMDEMDFTVFIGLGREPAHGKAYIRYVTTIGRPKGRIKDLYAAEGATVGEDPWDRPGKPHFVRFNKLDRYVRPKAFPVLAACYRVCLGVIKMIRDLEVLDGKGLRPIRDLAKVISLPMAKIILGKFLIDPNRALKNFLVQIADHIDLHRPSKDGLTLSHIPEKMLSLILNNELYGSDRSEPLPFFIKRGPIVAMQQFIREATELEEQIGVGRFESGSQWDPDIALQSVGLELVPNDELRSKYQAFGSNLLSVGAQITQAEVLAWEDKWFLYVPFVGNLPQRCEGLYLHPSEVAGEILILLESESYDPPWTHGGINLAHG